MYQDYLAKLPAPLDNSYFDVLILLVLTIYIVSTAISRIVDRAAFARMRKKTGREQGDEEGAPLPSLATGSGREKRPQSLSLQQKTGISFSVQQSSRVSDQDVAKALTEAVGLDDPKEIYDLREKDKVAAVRAALAVGASIRQIAVLTGISRSAVQRLSKKDG